MQNLTLTFIFNKFTECNVINKMNESCDRKKKKNKLKGIVGVMWEKAETDFLVGEYLSIDYMKKKKKIKILSLSLPPYPSPPLSLSLSFSL